MNTNSKIKDQISAHNNQISLYLDLIKEKKSNKDKKILYEKILELNNVEKQYIFSYLSLIENI